MSIDEALEKLLEYGPDDLSGAAAKVVLADLLDGMAAAKPLPCWRLDAAELRVCARQIRVSVDRVETPSGEPDDDRSVPDGIRWLSTVLPIPPKQRKLLTILEDAPGGLSEEAIIAKLWPGDSAPRRILNNRLSKLRSDANSYLARFKARYRIHREMRLYLGGRREMRLTIIDTR